MQCSQNCFQTGHSITQIDTYVKSAFIWLCILLLLRYISQITSNIHIKLADNRDKVEKRILDTLFNVVHYANVITTGIDLSATISTAK